MKKEIGEFLPNLKNRGEYLKKYSEKNPTAELGIIGRSILSKDIDYFRIGKGDRHIVAVGAHHAMEYITASALYDFIDFITEKSTRGDIYCGVNVRFLVRKFYDMFRVNCFKFTHCSLKWSASKKADYTVV